MDTNQEITIEFSEEQITEIIQKCGFVPKPIVTNGLSLTMLSLAATAKNSDILPLVNKISTCYQALESHLNISEKPIYTLALQLTKEQSELIENVVNKNWQQIIIVPDDYDINFKEIWGLETSVQKIGDKFLIISENEEFDSRPDQFVIKLPKVEDTNMTFGTGNHPTTQTILCLLNTYLQKEAKVLDIGTGSGILTVAAAKLGAKRIFATDINPIAVETAKVTAKLNNISEKVEFRVGDIEVIEDTYELVLANLFPKIIISLANDLAKKVSPNGIILLSGLVSARIPQIIEVMDKVGFDHLESLTIEFWGGIALKKRV